MASSTKITLSFPEPDIAVLTLDDPDSGANVLSRHVLESLGPGDRLYEWSSRTLLLLLERDSSLDEVRLEMTSLCSRRLDYFLDASERSALVTLSATWNLLPMEDTTVDKIIATVDSFDKAHTRKR